MEKSKKNDILNAYMIVENFSEGSFNQNGKQQFQSKDYHKEIMDQVKREKGNEGKDTKYTLSLYLGTFDFGELLNKYRERVLDEDDIDFGQKFTLCLKFEESDDGETLNYLPEELFFTFPGYMKVNEDVKIEKNSYLDSKLLKDFKTTETAWKDEIKKIFENEEHDFNEKISEVLKRYHLDIKSCWYSLGKSSGDSFLHSFFIEDLEKAKNIESPVLERYLNDNIDKNLRVNLAFEEKDELEKILKPENYPMGRFPSKIKFGLSLMQQVAVNLAINSGEFIRSVNGPPGTGKTTLLKDVFAELLVRQAKVIADTDCKSKSIEYTNKDGNSYKMSCIPDELADFNILVVSSNNTAVQNIVNELPKLEEIDESLRDEIEYLTIDGEESKNIFGVFSLEAGKKENINNLLKKITEIRKKYEKTSDEFSNAKKEFSKKYDEVSDYFEVIKGIDKKIEERWAREREAALLCEKREECKREKSKLSVEKEKLLLEKREYEKSVTAEVNRRKDLEEGIKSSKSDIETVKMTSPGLFTRIFNRKKAKEYNENIARYKKILIDKIDEKNKIEKNIATVKNMISGKVSEITSLDKKIAELEKAESRIPVVEEEIKRLGNEIASELEQEKLNGSDVLCWDYEKAQMSNPWSNEKLRKLQSELFIKALKLKKEYIIKNYKSTLRSLPYIYPALNKNDKNVENEFWKLVNFIIPVLSTTFASVGRMYTSVAPVISNLFVDEAGQATPQAAVGAFFRSKRVMVVGDPFQIEPVLTLDERMLKKIREMTGIDQRYLSSSSSVQSLVDAAGKYGFYKEMDDGESKEWIGIPLWVHRRSASPMFEVSNRISYSDLMVHGLPKDSKNGKANLIDIKGKAENKYVKEQGQYICSRIKELLESGVSGHDIYVITPFTNCANRLNYELSQINDNQDDGEKIQVGTVHKFQGKEAKIVFFMLGADENSRGAASWVVQKANMMNVAATRAKKEFYIVGDIQLYRDLNNKVIENTFEIIEGYNKNN